MFTSFLDKQSDCHIFAELFFALLGKRKNFFYNFPLEKAKQMFLLSKIIAANKMEMHHDFARANEMGSKKCWQKDYGIMGQAKLTLIPLKHTLEYKRKDLNCILN